MQNPIIVFDSGRGGLSIYLPLKAALPDQPIVYLDDREHFPYGDKSAAWLQDRFVQLSAKFNTYKPCLVVLACNTGTLNAIQVLRDLLSCPVVGVEPVIKPLAHFRHSLALMTPSAAESIQTAKLIQEFGSHVEVFAPPGLAEAIEFNNIDQVKKIIHKIKIIAQDHGIEAIGLSCTHFPLVLDQFISAMPEIKFIDPSAPVVQEVIRVLRLTQHE